MSIYPIADTVPYIHPPPSSGAGHSVKPGREDEQQDDSEKPKNSLTSSELELSRQEQQQVRALAVRDREVRAHESAHKAAGGGLTGPAKYTYTKGPDGKQYAAGGEVSIDTSGVSGDPTATVLKANRIRAAALAPANPSNQDRAVAVQADAMAAQARVEIRAEKVADGQAPENQNEDNTPALAGQENRERAVTNRSGAPVTAAYNGVANPVADESFGSRVDFFA